MLETSFYTLKQFKAYKSLDSYNYMVSGFITSVQGKAMGNNFVVIGKVRHSQRMNDGSFENEALENEDRSTKHPNLENEDP